MTNEDPDIAAISRRDVEWGEAVGRRDLEALVAIYTEDGTLVWPGQPAIHGTDGIRAAWTELLKAPGLALGFTPERIDVAGDRSLASDFGKVTMTQDGPNGPETVIAKYVVVWKRVGGVWQVLYDSFNMNSGS